MKLCPYCAEEIQEQAIVCRYCGKELVPQAVQAMQSTQGVQIKQPKKWYRQSFVVVVVGVLILSSIVWLLVVVTY